MAKPGTGGCCLDQSMTCRWHLESPKSKVKWNVNSLCAKCWSSNGLPEGKGIVLKFHKSFCNLRPRPCVQLYIHIYIYTSNFYIFLHTWNPNDRCFEWSLGLLYRGFFHPNNRSDQVPMINIDGVQQLLEMKHLTTQNVYTRVKVDGI